MKVFGCVLMLAVLLASPVQAQRATLTVTGFPVTFGPPTIADLDAGILTSNSATTFTVQMQTVGATRTTTVSIRCQTPCPASGTKPPAGLQWRRADSGTWNTLTTSDVVVEGRTVRPSQGQAGNNPWGNSLYWRTQIAWDDPASTHIYNIVMTLTVTPQ